jgi:hypothetical protein
MNEEIQNSQIGNKQLEKNEAQAFPAWAKIVSALLAVLIIIGLYLVFAKSKNADVLPQSADQKQAETTQSENQVPVSGGTLSETENQEEIVTADQGITSNVDVDYEMKKMDESIGSVDDNDFSSGSFSDAEIGL